MQGLPAEKQNCLLCDNAKGGSNHTAPLRCCPQSMQLFPEASAGGGGRITFIGFLAAQAFNDDSQLHEKIPVMNPIRPVVLVYCAQSSHCPGTLLCELHCNLGLIPRITTLGERLRIAFYTCGSIMYCSSLKRGGDGR